MRICCAAVIVLGLATGFKGTAFGQSVVKGPFNFEGASYALTGPYPSWHAAEADAIETYRGHLAAVTSAEMNQWLFEQFVLGTAGAWLGGTDEGSEGNWRWVNGKPFGYSNWRTSSGEPNGGTGENYLGFFENGEWNDYVPEGGYAIIEFQCTNPVESLDREWKSSPVASNIQARSLPGLIGPFANAGRLYYITQEPMSWPAARTFFESRGMALATVRNATQNDWIWQTFSPFGKPICCGYASNCFWIGLNDFATEGGHVWVSGEPVSFLNWYAGEPNNAGDEDAVHMMPPGKWNDYDPGFALPAVGEILCLPGQSAQRDWDRLLTTSTPWLSTSNWKDGIVPGDFDTARFNSAQPASAIVTNNAALQLRIDRNTLTFVPINEPHIRPDISFISPASALCVIPESLVMMGSDASPAVLELANVGVWFDRRAIVGRGEGARAVIDIGETSSLRLSDGAALVLADGFEADALLRIAGKVEGAGTIVVGGTGKGVVDFAAEGDRSVEARSIMLGESLGGDGSILSTGEIKLTGPLVVGEKGKGSFTVAEDSQLESSNLHIGRKAGADGRFTSAVASGDAFFRGGSESPGPGDFITVGDEGKGLLDIDGLFAFERDGVDYSFGTMTIGGGTDLRGGDGTLSIRNAGPVGGAFRAPNLRVRTGTAIDSNARVSILNSTATIWSLETGAGDSEISVLLNANLRVRGNTQIGEALGVNIGVDVGNPEEQSRLVISGGDVECDGIRVGGRHTNTADGNASLLVRGVGTLDANVQDENVNSFNGGRVIIAGGSAIFPARAECRDRGLISAERAFIGYDENTTPQSGELVLDGPGIRLDLERRLQLGFRFPQDTSLQNYLIFLGGAQARCETFTLGRNGSPTFGSGPASETIIIVGSVPLRPEGGARAQLGRTREEPAAPDILCDVFEFYGDLFPEAIIVDSRADGEIVGEGPFPSQLPFVNMGILRPIVQPPDLYQNIENTIEFASNFTQASTGVLHLDYYFNNNDSFDFSRGAITVAGTATLDGTLHLNYAGFCCGWSGPEMYIGRRVDAVRAQSVLGRFDKIEVAPSFRGVRARAEYTPTAVEIVFMPPCAGDLNSDDQVDDTDFQSFLLGYNILDCADAAMPAGCPADLNRDGLVDDADFPVFVVAYNELLCP